MIAEPFMTAEPVLTAEPFVITGLDRPIDPDPPRRVLLAAPRSFCAGVERAIDVVRDLLGERGGPLHVRKQIVHNAHVVAELEAAGAVFVDDLDEVPEGAPVVFSAH